jgi:hypothetical protein
MPKRKAKKYKFKKNMVDILSGLATVNPRRNSSAFNSRNFAG